MQLKYSLVVILAFACLALVMAKPKPGGFGGRRSHARKARSSGFVSVSVSDAEVQAAAKYMADTITVKMGPQPCRVNKIEIATVEEVVGGKTYGLSISIICGKGVIRTFAICNGDVVDKPGLPQDNRFSLTIGSCLPGKP